MYTRLLLLAALCLLAPRLFSQDATDEATEIFFDSLDLTQEQISNFGIFLHLDSIEQTLNFIKDTTVSLGDGMVDLTVPPGYRLLMPDDARTVLVDLWGNPPENAEGTLAMLFPDSTSLANGEGFGVDIYFSEDGYVNDEDAADIDYDELLETMREDVAAGNEYRREQGYETMEFLGWAAKPRYDAVNKRLHWAKRLRFETEEEETLNYNILFLGRRGYLTMNVIGNVTDLPEIDASLDDFLGSASFNAGHAYADFDPDIDEVAAYGIGALVAGKVLAKSGLLAGLGIFLAKAWKLIAVGFIAVAGGLKKLLGRGDA